MIRGTHQYLRSDSWGEVDVQVDFTGLAIIRPHRTLPDRVRQCTPKVSEALTTELPCSRDKLAQQLFKTEDLLWPGWARPRRPWLLGSQEAAGTP